MFLWYCILYLALTGTAAFLLGRIFPKNCFHANQPPFRPFPFEKNGAIYNCLGVRRWQNKLPDMSRLLPSLMPAKNISTLQKEGLQRMLQETCVAEIIHALLMLTGLYCIRLWPGAGGIAIAVINAFVFNLPFIIIQRYNRPRLLRLQKRKERSLC